MADAEDTPAAAPDPCDAVDLDVLAAHAAEPVGDGGSQLGKAVVALVGRCVALARVKEPPPHADVRCDFRHPAVAVMLLTEQLLEVRRSEESTGAAASAAHLGLCLLLLYVDSGDAALRTWTTVTAPVDWPEDVSPFPGVVFPNGEIMAEPPEAMLRDFLRELVDELVGAGGAPRPLCDVARRASVGTTEAGADMLLADIDAAVRQVERGALIYRIDATRS